MLGEHYSFGMIYTIAFGDHRQRKNESDELLLLKNLIFFVFRKEGFFPEGGSFCPQHTQEWAPEQAKELH